MFRRYERSVCDNTSKLAHFPEVRDYCYAMLMGYRKECFGVISLSTQMKVLGSRIVAEGVLTEVPAYPRLVVETALNYNAYFVILCHNHPGGIAEPSKTDLEMTLSLEIVLKHLGINLLDHIIVAADSTYSMNNHEHLRYCSLRPQKGSNCFREEEQVYVLRDEGELE
jgi:DNA repair protein RadC